MKSKVITASEAAALIPDDAVVSISSSSGLGCPDAVLQAIGERFEKEQAPESLTTFHPIAAGDMYGIDGIDHIARKGLLKRVIAGSLPSGPSSMPSPKIWQMIYANEVEAYNILGLVGSIIRSTTPACSLENKVLRHVFPPSVLL